MIQSCSSFSTTGWRQSDGDSNLNLVPKYIKTVLKLYFHFYQVVQSHKYMEDFNTTSCHVTCVNIFKLFVWCLLVLLMKSTHLFYTISFNLLQNVYQVTGNELNPTGDKFPTQIVCWLLKPPCWKRRTTRQNASGGASWEDKGNGEPTGVQSR